ncbi:protoporphyrinogen oxidase [Halobacteriales archaeon QS_8_69_26]|nr:MAG: protoporphyrinogen oxidase [Halobacteriales archaeon QS_8_69_26]
MRVGVVGAGITGLSLVHHLRERDVSAVAFEAEDRPGGVVRSDRIDGRVVERGPHRIRLTDPVEELVEAVGLAEEVIRADDDLPLYVYRNGRLREVPRSLGAFLRTDLLSWRGKLRTLAEPLTDAADPDERLDDLFTRKFGAEAYRYVVEPLLSGIYASDPAEMQVRHATPGLLRVEERDGNLLRPALRRARSDGTAPPVSFEGGLGTLPRAVHDAHEDRVHLDEPVERVEDDGDRYAVVTDDRRETVDRVVVTTPAGAAADVLEPVAPDAADRLRRLNYNPIAMVYLRSDADLTGFGYQVAAGEGLRTRGVTFVDSLFGRESPYTAFLGGMSDPSVIDDPEEELAETARREFEAVTGGSATARGVNRLRAYPAHDTSWTALDGMELPGGIRLATNYTGRIGVPSRVREARRIAEELAGGAD